MVKKYETELERVLDQSFNGIMVNTIALVKLTEINYDDEPEKLKKIKKEFKDKIFERINEIFNY